MVYAGYTPGCFHGEESSFPVTVALYNGRLKYTDVVALVIFFDRVFVCVRREIAHLRVEIAGVDVETT
jgi:hypothetical protein